INRLTQYASWFYYHCRQLERWELVAIGAAVVAVVLLVGVRGKARTRIRYLRGRSPIVGIRLAGHRRH
ncbi:MAG: hypothetical protein ACYS74_21815, partial [Planctomycetota bacterium]